MECVHVEDLLKQRLADLRNAQERSLIDSSLDAMRQERAALYGVTQALSAVVARLADHTGRTMAEVDTVTGAVWF